MRVYARKRKVDINGTRGITKTYTKLLYEMVNGIAWPGTQVAYYGPSYKQMAAIGSKTFHQIEHDYPGLAAMWSVSAESKDDFKIETDGGSAFYISAMRGDNIHAVTAEEFAQEEDPAFDHGEYSAVVLPAVRLWHNVNGQPDSNFVGYKQHAITSAGRKQNHSYETRCSTQAAMAKGDSAWAYDISWECVVLQLMRPHEWAMGLKEELTPEKWMREMETRFTGTDENPIVRDDVLQESCCVMTMEEHHCCKDRDCRLSPDEVIYVIGYDVSYEDNKNNAKCACVVVKLTKQSDFLKRDKYLKQVVYVDDWPPPTSNMMQAKRLKQLWYRYCYEGSETYIAIDGWQYGKAVIEGLMMDLGDGLDPLCIYNHEHYAEMELEHALPVIYPIKAGGSGVTDPDSEMIRNAEIQFENHNVQLLTANRHEGLNQFKRLHRIKDDYFDARIDRPYRKTRELVGQIQNLKKVPSGAGVSEKRISKSIQRDSWSALKYALRFSQKLEKTNLMVTKKKSDWDEILEQYRNGAAAAPTGGGRSRTTIGRHGGRIV